MSALITVLMAWLIVRHIWMTMGEKLRRSADHHWRCRCEDCMPPGMYDGIDWYSK